MRERAAGSGQAQTLPVAKRPRHDAEQPAVVGSRRQGPIIQEWLHNRRRRRRSVPQQRLVCPSVELVHAAGNSNQVNASRE